MLCVLSCSRCKEQDFVFPYLSLVCLYFCCLPQWCESFNFTNDIDRRLSLSFVSVHVIISTKSYRLFEPCPRFLPHYSTVARLKHLARAFHQTGGPRTGCTITGSQSGLCHSLIERCWGDGPPSVVAVRLCRWAQHHDRSKNSTCGKSDGEGRRSPWRRCGSGVRLGCDNPRSSIKKRWGTRKKPRVSCHPRGGPVDEHTHDADEMPREVAIIENYYMSSKRKK